MYRSDAEVELDVEMLRRRLKEEPVERQVQIRKRSTDVRAHDIKNGEHLVWWVVHLTGKPVGAIWFAFDRNDQGKLEVRERANKVELLAEVETVEAAMMAGMMMVDRPS